MTRTLVFDTETNGKRPKYRRGEREDPGLEPAVTQIAAMLFLDRRPVGHISCFVRPINFNGTPATIPDEKFFVDSGITQDTVDAVGLESRVGLAVFNQFVRVADRIVAHNIQFDDPVVRSAYARVAASQRAYWDTPKFCTMKTLEPVLKLPGNFGYKFPKLDECYRVLVDPMGFEGAHDAMVDVQACADVLWATEDAGHDLWKLAENWPEE